MISRQELREMSLTDIRERYSGTHMKTVRYFECKIEGHYKFWEITYESPKADVIGRRVSAYSTRWGQIGSNGTRKDCPSASTRDITKLINSKLAKGYKEVGAKAPPLPIEPKGPPPKKIPGGFEIF